MNQWEVWTAVFPYEDDPKKFKKRPVIIIDVESLKVLSVKVTHHEKRVYDDYDVPICKWKEIGLKQPSVARVSKTIYLTKDKFDRCIGKLLVDDVKPIYEKFIKFIENSDDTNT